MRKEVPLAIAGVVGFVVLLDYFVKLPVLNEASKLFQDWAVIVAAFALALASISLIQRNVRIVAERRTEWIYSLFLLGGLVYFTTAGIVWGITAPPFRVGFDAVFSPVGAATFSLLVFFIASAAFRAFRVRNAEATVLLLSGFLVMLGNAPVGEALWGQFPVISDWLIRIPNVAGNRGIMIGAALGSLAIGIRILLGLDRSYLGLE